MTPKKPCLQEVSSIHTFVQSETLSFSLATTAKLPINRDKNINAQELRILQLIYSFCLFKQNQWHKYLLRIYEHAVQVRSLVSPAAPIIWESCKVAKSFQKDCISNSQGLLLFRKQSSGNYCCNQGRKPFLFYSTVMQRKIE